jgi:putative ABC transport system permease protein
MSAPALLEENHGAPAVPPARRPTWPRWRPATRLALRDARASRQHSMLVIALVALPVALVVGVYLFGTSRTWGDLQQPRVALGAVAAGSAEPATTAPALGWSDPLPDSWRLVPWPSVGAFEGSPMGGETVGGTAGDLSDPVIAGLVDLQAGRLPTSVDEVLITPDLAESRALDVGDTWTPGLWDWAGTAENPSVPLEVVGVGDLAGVPSGGSFVVGGIPPGWGNGPLGGDRVLIDSPAPITAEQIATAAAAGVRVVGRDVPIEDPDRMSLTISDELVVGLALAFLQIVMLAGAAFAVSTRRRQRELALLSSAGAEPGDLTRAVLASGMLLGAVGAVLGFTLPWLVLVGGRPALERSFGWALAPVPPMESALLLVPAVGLLAAVAASVVPARMAARIPLAAALRARDSASIRLGGAGVELGRPPVRSALAGVALIVAGGLFLVGYPAGSEGQGVGGPIWALGLSVLICEVGVVLLAPFVLALVSGHAGSLPLAARLASRDAARNRLRSAFAVAAVAVSVGLLAGSLTWLSSVESALRDAYRPAAAPGALILARTTEQVRWGELGPADLSAVASEFPDARVSLIGIGPTWDERAGDSLAVGSQCDPLTDLGVTADALGVMDPLRRASLASQLSAGDPCRAPLPAGSPVTPQHVIGDVASVQRPGVVVADADGAAMLLGRDDPVVREQLESGSAVALAPSTVVDGAVRIAADPRLVGGGEAGPVQWRPGPSADVPAVFVEFDHAPAAVIVAPQALTSRGLPASSNAILVVPDAPIPGLQPFTDQLVSTAGLRVMSVESGPPPSPMGSPSWGEPLALGPVEFGWGLVVLPLAFALLATILVTALALGDARPELVTMGAVGASPRVRRLFAMWAAAVVAAVGALLGVLAGIAPAWAAVRSIDLIMDPAACLWSPLGPSIGGQGGDVRGTVYCDVPLAVPLDVPWMLLVVVVIGLPVVSGLLFAAFTRSRLPLPRR